MHPDSTYTANIVNNTTFSRITATAVLKMYLQQLVFQSKTAMRRKFIDVYYSRNTAVNTVIPLILVTLER